MKKIFLILFHVSILLSRGAPQDIDQLRIGNFALPYTQQLAPLFSVGQLVIEKNAALALLWGQHTVGFRTKETFLTPALLYGITDFLSVFINIPFATHLKSKHNHSGGLSDMYAQFECSIYNDDHYTYSNQATLIGTIILPTGSSSKYPRLGTGTPGFFLGGTYSHLAVDWYYFTSGGCLLSTQNKHEKMGNEFLYQAGFGRNLGNPWGCIFTFFCELDGFYEQHSRVKDILDKNSGGNIIFFGPTLWLSSEKFIWQIGVQFPILQQLNGNQHTLDYTFAFDFAWTFL